MRQPAIKFIISVLLLAALCALLQFVWNQKMEQTMQLKSGYLLLGIFVFIVTATHLLLLSMTKGSAQGFVRGFMAATAIKLMAYMTVLVVFFVFTQENKKTLVLYFLFYYFVFTIFEVSRLYSDVRKVN